MPAALPPDTVTCKLCRRQFAKYTCPACNVPYCALTCFRSDAHAACSESFYKREVEADIRGAPSKNAQERARMLALLKRFEEESAAAAEDNTDVNADLDNVDGLDEDSDEEDAEAEDTLARRLRRVDLESTSSSALWSLLPPALRARFLRTIENPTSDLARQLLADAAAIDEGFCPWWGVNGSETGGAGALPAPIDLPPALLTARNSGSGSELLYNICAVLIAYAYTTRHLARSPLATSLPFSSPHQHSATDDPSDDPDPDPEQDARVLLATLVPFLTARASTTRHITLEDALTGLRSRLPGDTPLAPLLRDAAVLLRPARVIVLKGPSLRHSGRNDVTSPDAAALPLAADASSLPPSADASAQGETTHPLHANLQDSTAHPYARALGDLHALFLTPTRASTRAHGPIVATEQETGPGTQQRREKGRGDDKQPRAHVAHKLAFYGSVLAQLSATGVGASLPGNALRALADELERAAEVEEAEASAFGIAHEGDNGTELARTAAGGGADTRGWAGPRIQEVSRGE